MYKYLYIAQLLYLEIPYEINICDVIPCKIIVCNIIFETLFVEILSWRYFAGDIWYT